MENNINNSRAIYSKHGDKAEDDVGDFINKQLPFVYMFYTISETFTAFYIHYASAWQTFQNKTIKGYELLVKHPR